MTTMMTTMKKILGRSRGILFEQARPIPFSSRRTLWHDSEMPPAALEWESYSQIFTARGKSAWLGAIWTCCIGEIDVWWGKVPGFYSQLNCQLFAIHREKSGIWPILREADQQKCWHFGIWSICQPSKIRLNSGQLEEYFWIADDRCFHSISLQEGQTNSRERNANLLNHR